MGYFMNMILIDSHCHLDDDRFEEDRDQVIQRANDLGIQQFVIAATTAQRWPKIKQICEAYQGVSASYGLHPMFMQEHQSKHVAELDAWLDTEDAVAVGECGLDFYQGNSDEQQQLELFRGQLTVSINHKLPVIIHSRKSLDLILREIRNSGISHGVIHSFSGSLQQAEQLVDLGFKLGIAATVSFERAKKLREVVSKIDINALMIESDAPDQAGQQHRGDRNEPAFIIDHLRIMAELRNMPVVELAQKVTQNCRDLFALSKS